MKRILYAWELGGGLGHVSRFLPLARALKERGCELSWALSDPAPVQVLLAGRGEPVLKAPLMALTPEGLPFDQMSYSEVLLHQGYNSVPVLTAALGGWRELLVKAAPDLVVADHAPTALLAARSLGVPCTRIGTGFCCPPAIDPEPPLMEWRAPDAARSAATARTLLGNASAALAAFGAAPVNSLAQFHAVDEDIVTTYAELDHYPLRTTPRWGVVLGAEAGAAPVWPQAPGRRVFAYLKGRQAQTVPILRALRRKHCAVLAYCPGLSPADRAMLEGGTMRFSDQPLDIEQACAQADLVVCGGGHGTVCAALLAGKPLLLAIEVTEQGITAMNVEKLGAGLGLGLAQASRAGSLLTRLLHEPGFARAARDFHFRHGAMSQARIVQAIAARCAELAASPRPDSTQTAPV